MGVIKAGNVPAVPEEFGGGKATTPKNEVPSLQEGEAKRQN
jgi:hypothetical protein